MRGDSKLASIACVRKNSRDTGAQNSKTASACLLPSNGGEQRVRGMRKREPAIVSFACAHDRCALRAYERSGYLLRHLRAAHSMSVADLEETRKYMERQVYHCRCNKENLRTRPCISVSPDVTLHDDNAWRMFLIKPAVALKEPEKNPPKAKGRPAGDDGITKTSMSPIEWSTYARSQFSEPEPTASGMALSSAPISSNHLGIFKSPSSPRRKCASPWRSHNPRAPSFQHVAEPVADKSRINASDAHTLNMTVSSSTLASPVALGIAGTLSVSDASILSIGMQMEALEQFAAAPDSSFCGMYPPVCNIEMELQELAEESARAAADGLIPDWLPGATRN